MGKFDKEFSKISAQCFIWSLNPECYINSVPKSMNMYV